jgi:hypothetical protein
MLGFMKRSIAAPRPLFVERIAVALLAAIALGLAGGYAAKGFTSVSTPAKVNVVQPAKDHSWTGPAPAPYAPSHKHQTVF